VGEVNRERFQQLLQLVPPPEGRSVTFNEGEILHLEVDVEAKTWTFTFRFPELLPPDMIHDWVSRLKAKFSTIAAVEAQFCYHAETDIKEGLHTYWPLLLTCLKEEWPSFSLRRYLEIHPRIEEDTLYFPALNGTSLEYLKSNKAEEVIATFYHRWCGIRPKVKLVVYEEAEELHTMFRKQREQEDEQFSLQAAHEEATKQTEDSKQAKDEEIPKQEGPLTYGHAIAEDPVPLATIVEEERRVVVQGTIFGMETRELKSGSTLVLLKITDFTGSILVKVFARGKEEMEKLAQFK
jgi:DNA polymerase-3 subunit alpha (Gram-positive type)